MPKNKTFDPYHDVLLKLPLEGQRLLLTILSRNDPLDPSTSRKVRDACQRYEKELESFGLIPDYYAYALIYWATNQNPQAIAQAAARLNQVAADTTQSFAEDLVKRLLNN